MSDDVISKSTARLVKAIGDAAHAKVLAEAHMTDRDAFQFASAHRRAVSNARVALDAAIDTAAEHLRHPPQVSVDT